MLFSDQQTQQAAVFDQSGKWKSGGVFNGWGKFSNPADWENNLPALSTMEFFSSDPSYANLFDLSTKGSNGSSFFIQELGRSATFSAMRNCVTTVSTAFGYFQSAIGSLKLMFKDTLTTISRVLENVSTVMDSIEIAVNSISWIPIVGWIIKIIFEVAKIVTSIISSVKERKAQRRQSELDKIARQYGLPMAEWTPEADTIMCQMLQMNLAPGRFNLEWAFSPRYPAIHAGDFVANHQKPRPDANCFAAWLVYSNRFKAGTADAAGLGFVPGTMNIHGAMSLNTNAGGDVKDYGDFFPITRTVASQLWQQAVKGDSGLTFAVDTDKLIKMWKDYAAAAYHYGLEAFGGWSMISGRIDKSEPLTLSEIKSGVMYNCSECDTGNSNCDSNLAGKKTKWRWRTPPGDGHRSAFLQHIHSMFGWKKFQHGESLKEDDWWDTMIPVKALRNLRERQDAMIRSPKCMYLDDSTNADGTGQPRFRSIRKGSEQHKLWQNCVTAMFESGDWKRIDYRDVIPGEDVDNAIRLVLSNRYNTTPEKFFNMDKKIGQGLQSLSLAAPKTKSVLGDPEPPAPPEPIQISTSKVNGMPLSPDRAEGVRSPRKPKRAVGGKSKKSSSAPLIIGAAAVGLLMMKGRK